MLLNKLNKMWIHELTPEQRHEILKRCIAVYGLNQNTSIWISLYGIITTSFLNENGEPFETTFEQLDIDYAKYLELQPKITKPTDMNLNQITTEQLKELFRVCKTLTAFKFQTDITIASTGLIHAFMSETHYDAKFISVEEVRQAHLESIELNKAKEYHTYLQLRDKFEPNRYDDVAKPFNLRDAIGTITTTHNTNSYPIGSIATNS